MGAAYLGAYRRILGVGRPKAKVQLKYKRAPQGAGKRRRWQTKSAGLAAGPGPAAGGGGLGGLACCGWPTHPPDTFPPGTLGVFFSPTFAAPRMVLIKTISALRPKKTGWGLYTQKKGKKAALCFLTSAQLGSPLAVGGATRSPQDKASEPGSMPNSATPSRRLLTGLFFCRSRSWARRSCSRSAPISARVN